MILINKQRGRGIQIGARDGNIQHGRITILTQHTPAPTARNQRSANNVGSPYTVAFLTDIVPPFGCVSQTQRPDFTEKRGKGIAVGTSGWSYDHWCGVLYPEGILPRDRPAHYKAEFQPVELNASFYRWPKPSTFASWRRRLPEGFRLSVKASRGLTHGKKLYAPDTWIQKIAKGWHELGDRRAVLLVQLPPGMVRDDARLGYFLKALPPWSQVAVEFRNPT